MNSAGYYVIGLLLIAIGALAWLRVRPGARDALQPGEVIHLLVTAAEQMLPGYSGETKLEWVLAELAQFGLNLDPRVERLMVEAAVYFLKQAKVQPKLFSQENSRNSGRSNTVQLPVGVNPPKLPPNVSPAVNSPLLGNKG